MEEAEEAYEKVMELAPDDIEIWLDYSSLMFEEGKNEEAIAIISEGIKNNTGAAELYYRMVAYLFANGQYKEAISYLEQALIADPEKYELLFEYLPQLQNNKVIIDIVNRYIGE
ncbi:Tetratricopeptide repeat protein [compost metagenome]